MNKLGVSYDHIFSSDIDPEVVKTIRANQQPGTLYGDISERKVDEVPEVDLYTAGFPCQPFSLAGKKQGFWDEKGRGTLFFDIFNYLEKKQPKAFILENVQGITKLHGGTYTKAILKVLRSIRLPGGSRGQAYEIHHQVLNTREHSVPQNRPRWYCVGIRRDTFQGESSTFAFPEPISPCPTIDLFLDEDSKVGTSGFDDLSSKAKARIRRLKQRTEGSSETPYIGL